MALGAFQTAGHTKPHDDRLRSGATRQTIAAAKMERLFFSTVAGAGPRQMTRRNVHCRGHTFRRKEDMPSD